jgi:hypothetical protein
MPDENSDAMTVAMGGPNIIQQTRANNISFKSMISSFEFLPNVCKLFTNEFMNLLMIMHPWYL